MAITDESGGVTDRFQYAPYGELVYRTGGTKTPFLFNGRYGVMTDSNGLYYMRARYYNPQIKWFINWDVLQGAINNGQSLNRYAYVNGNPISNIDPTGNSPFTGNNQVDLVLPDIIENETNRVIHEEVLDPAWKVFNTPRMPDYYSANINVTVPNPVTGELAGWSGEATVDRNGNIYFAPKGVSAGLSWPYQDLLVQDG